MKKVKNKAKMQELIKLAGTLPHLCDTKDELFQSLDELCVKAREELCDSDYNQFEIAINFFRAIVLKKNKNKGVNN